MSMKKTARSILIVIVIVFAAFAAGFVTGNQQTDLTAQELAQALDIHYYTIQVPDDIPPDSFAELRIMHYDGRSTGGAGFNQLKSKDKIKVFFWKEPEGKDFNVCMTKRGSTNRFKLSDKFQPTGMFLTSYNDNTNEILEAMKDGTQVVKTYDCGGGSGVFTSMYLIRFETDTAIDTDGLIYERLLMKVVGKKQ